MLSALLPLACITGYAPTPQSRTSCVGWRECEGIRGVADVALGRTLLQMREAGADPMSDADADPTSSGLASMGPICPDPY
jgi:hypothetical protein